LEITVRIGLRQVRALKKGETIWDQSLPGFGARRQNSEAVSYFLYYRTAEGRQRWYTIGKHGAWTPDAAREEARRVRGDVARKTDPAAEKRAKRQAKTVADLCDSYLKDVEAGRVITRRRVPKKPSTIGSDRDRIERHIKPLLGRMKVAAVSREECRGLHARCSRGQNRSPNQGRL
jgi:Arm DNA-binding domain